MQRNANAIYNFINFWLPIFFYPLSHSYTNRQPAVSLVDKSMYSQIYASKPLHPNGYQNNKAIVILVAISSSVTKL